MEEEGEGVKWIGGGGLLMSGPRSGVSVPDDDDGDIVIAEEKEEKEGGEKEEEEGEGDMGGGGCGCGCGKEEGLGGPDGMRSGGRKLCVTGLGRRGVTETGVEGGGGEGRGSGTPATRLVSVQRHSWIGERSQPVPDGTVCGDKRAYILRKPAVNPEHTLRLVPSACGGMSNGNGCSRVADRNSSPSGGRTTSPPCTGSGVKHTRYYPHTANLSLPSSAPPLPTGIVLPRLHCITPSAACPSPQPPPPLRDPREPPPPHLLFSSLTLPPLYSIYHYPSTPPIHTHQPPSSLQISQTAPINLPPLSPSPLPLVHNLPRNRNSSLPTHPHRQSQRSLPPAPARLHRLELAKRHHVQCGDPRSPTRFAAAQC